MLKLTFLLKESILYTLFYHAKGMEMQEDTYILLRNKELLEDSREYFMNEFVSIYHYIGLIVLMIACASLGIFIANASGYHSIGLALLATVFFSLSIGMLYMCIVLSFSSDFKIYISIDDYFDKVMSMEDAEELKIILPELMCNNINEYYKLISDELEKIKSEFSSEEVLKEFHELLELDITLRKKHLSFFKDKLKEFNEMKKFNEEENEVAKQLKIAGFTKPNKSGGGLTLKIEES
jgi:hypothetical protein